MSVFISYSSKDSEFVQKLSLSLVQNRIHVWLDKWEMQPGDSLIDMIQSGLTNSSFLLVVLSNNSVNSAWCKKELNSGLMRELEEKKVVVIPILIEDCEIPILLKEKLYADFRNDFEEGFKSLIRPLSKLISEHMGRQVNKDLTTDYGINWGLKNGLFTMTIDIVNWYGTEQKSILIQLEVHGCENATRRYKRQVEIGMDWLMKESIISMMYVNEDFRQLNILAQNNQVYNMHIQTKDIKMDITFDVKIRTVLLGVDNGKDVLLNFVDFLELLDSSRKERIN